VLFNNKGTVVTDINNCVVEEILYYAVPPDNLTGSLNIKV
jgi:hypothetical protein